MPHSFWHTGILGKLRGADPLICAGRPVPKDPQLATENCAGLGASKRTRGPHYNLCSRPQGTKLCGIGIPSCPTKIALLLAVGVLAICRRPVRTSEMHQMVRGCSSKALSVVSILPRGSGQRPPQTPWHL